MSTSRDDRVGSGSGDDGRMRAGPSWLAGGELYFDPGDSAPEPFAEEAEAAVLECALTPFHPLPAQLRERLVAEGRAIAAARWGAGRLSEPAVAAVRERSGSRGARWLVAGLAATVVGAVGLGVLALGLQLHVDDQAERLREALAQIERNEVLLAESNARADSAAARLAEATGDLDRARATIAHLTEPKDPQVLAQNRQRLLEVAGTIELDWVPFNLDPDAPDAVQNGEVTGSVVWNDEAQAGYLTFRGLKVNDPSVEQYQVWVIDERGLEQKVSGGVFNATRDGEVIVPIEPGIEVGRVQLFAVTVEDPGGTWVPDLQRRVVVAPREG